MDVDDMAGLNVEYVGTATIAPRQTVEPRISAIICTRDRPHIIGRAVNSVARQTYGSFDVVIVDQSAGDETRQIVLRLQAEHPHIRYLHLDIVGVSHGYNVAIESTKSEILAFTDDDCIVPKTWLEDIARAFAAEPSGDMLYGQVLLPEEMRAREGVDGTTPWLRIAKRKRLNRREGFHITGMGADFAARRSLWERLGGFDEILCAGGPLASTQDFDFAYRAFRRGATILLEPDVVAYHYGFRSHAQWPATLRRYAVGDGAFYLKHVRLGDLYAAQLMARWFGRMVAREIKRSLKGGPQADQWGYVRHFLIGMRESLRFGVDRRNRLYYVRHP